MSSGSRAGEGRVRGRVCWTTGIHSGYVLLTSRCCRTAHFAPPTAKTCNQCCGRRLALRRSCDGHGVSMLAEFHLTAFVKQNSTFALRVRAPGTPSAWSGNTRWGSAPQGGRVGSRDITHLQAEHAKFVAVRRVTVSLPCYSVPLVFGGHDRQAAGCQGGARQCRHVVCIYLVNVGLRWLYLQLKSVSKTESGRVARILAYLAPLSQAGLQPAVAEAPKAATRRHARLTDSHLVLSILAPQRSHAAARRLHRGR